MPSCHAGRSRPRRSSPPSAAARLASAVMRRAADIVALGQVLPQPASIRSAGDAHPRRAPQQLGAMRAGQARIASRSSLARRCTSMRARALSTSCRGAHQPQLAVLGLEHLVGGSGAVKAAGAHRVAAWGSAAGCTAAGAREGSAPRPRCAPRAGSLLAVSCARTASTSHRHRSAAMRPTAPPSAAPYARCRAGAPLRAGKGNQGAGTGRSGQEPRPLRLPGAEARAAHAGHVLKTTEGAARAATAANVASHLQKAASPVTRCQRCTATST
jgi:hypothetical protein